MTGGGTWPRRIPEQPLLHLSEAGRELLHPFHDSNPFAAAALRGLNHHRVADSFGGLAVERGRRRKKQGVKKSPLESQP